MSLNIIQKVDEVALQRILLGCSVSLWMPLLSVFVYTNFTSPVAFVHNAVSVAALGITVACLTVYITLKASGDWLIFTSFLAGFVGDHLGFQDTCTPQSVEPLNVSSRNQTRVMWLLGCLLFGMIAGVLSKAKDVADGRYSPRYFLSERLYIVAPFAIGEAVAHLWNCGWVAVLDVFVLNFLSLATVGFCLLVHRILQKAGVWNTDLIGAVMTLFQSSFGSVVGVVSVTLLSLFFVVIPMLQKLFEMNTLLSSFGIAMEIIFYDVL